MTLLATLREGRAERFPACCRWRFALEELVTAGRSEQSLKRGVRFTTTGVEYAPCRVIHRATLTHAEYERRLQGVR